MGRYDDNDEDEKPAPRRSRIADAEEEKPTRRRRQETEIDSDAGSDADDDDETPKVNKTADRRKIQRGWGNAEQTKSADSPFAQRLKVTSDQQIIKFLEDDPYTSYRQHWLDSRQGQKSFTCISDIDPKGCPLCVAGDRPSARFAFNVILMDENSDPLVKSYEVGPRVIDQLKNFHQDPKMGPLPKNYWAVSKTGTKSTSQVNHQVVKANDLLEDWDIEPLTADEITALKKSAYDETIVSIPTYKVLKNIAAEELAG